ncbi:protein of unknown function (DUF4397) [Rubrobacter radiotolerans]|uniref:DUF4397 domain-containing protein n=1 Tax=Rubrobacter radiotolerans TaxID=42256 RepID=A0A023X5S1_RUBRA|nr:DUF4397 domain-containing protein [Rubrobacter radiotolerans]AHY47822.1 protein of unknown function (DUF4397) [Rubrobacter radiotolerans]MDX5892461.1 DUF4397 domain-containing protein [Rubrobacter radiotolerans]SMC07752.1 protein of unknown function [Rubrobacter radiotolerans DSM 5868]
MRSADRLAGIGATLRGLLGPLTRGGAARLALLLLVALPLGALPATARETGEPEKGAALVRVVHLSPDAPAVRVTVDGEDVKALSDVAYLDATPYLELPAGPHRLAAYPTEAEPDVEPVLEAEIEPGAGESYTVVGIGLVEDETLAARLFVDNNREPERGKAKVRIVHAVPDLGPARVGSGDTPELLVLPGFSNASGYAEVDGGTYTLDVTPSGADSPAFSFPEATVEAGSIYTAFAVGQAAEKTLGAIVTEDSAEGEVVARTGDARKTKENSTD